MRRNPYVFYQIPMRSYPVTRYLRGPRGKRGVRGPRGYPGPPGPSNSVSGDCFCTGNLIVNSSFEHCTENLPNEWYTDQPEIITKSKTPNEIHSGNNSVVFQLTYNTKSAKLYQIIDNVNENCCYDLQFWVKGVNGGGTINIQLHLLDEDNLVLHTPINVNIMGGSLSSNFFSSYRYITPPTVSGANKAKLEFNVVGFGRAFIIDDVILTCIG